MSGSKGGLLAGMVLPEWHSTAHAEEQPLPNDVARVARASRFVAGASWQEAFRQSADQEEVTSHQQEVISQPQVENITSVKTLSVSFKNRTVCISSNTSSSVIGAGWQTERISGEREREREARRG